MIRERDHPYESDLLYNTKPTPPVFEEDSSFDLERASQRSFSPHVVRYPTTQETLIKKMREIVSPKERSEAIPVEDEAKEVGSLTVFRGGMLEELRKQPSMSEQPSTDHIMFGYHK